MTSEAVLQAIKETVRSILPESRILLFGSHARGTQDKHSDYDLMVITPNLLTRAEKLSWYSQLDKAIVDAIHAPIDLLLYSEQEVMQMQALPGHIVHTAVKEGRNL